MPESDDDGYEAASRRSPNALDMETMAAAFKQVNTLNDFTGGYVDSAEVVVASQYGYVIGTWWWDSEGEVWRADFKRFGEER